MRKVPGHTAGLGKGSLYCWPNSVWGGSNLALAFLLAHGCVYFSMKIYAHNVGQWHLGIALFAWKCQLEGVISWQETGMCN